MTTKAGRTRKPTQTAQSLPNGHGSARPPRNNRRLKTLKPSATLGDIARGTGLNVEHVSRIFNKKRTPRLKTAARIAEYLGVSIDRLYAALTA